MKRKMRKIFLSIGAVLLIMIIACGIYLGDFYRADMEQIEKFTVEHKVAMQTDADGNLVFEPENVERGFIFYPGEKVEYTAYVPLMPALASEGTLCILVEMPFNLAVFDINAADGLQGNYPEIEEWYIGGHSLGGSMAAAYLEKHSDTFDGLILLGSYSTADLSGLDIEVMSIYGSEDKVLNKEKYDANKCNLPADFTEVVIEGGCHAYFGMYGAQNGDGIPSISGEEQIGATLDAVNGIWNVESRRQKLRRRSGL